MSRANFIGGLALPAIDQLIQCRSHVPDLVILDVLALAQWLEPRIAECTIDDFRVLTTDLAKVWNCSDATACRRMGAILKYDLADASRLATRGAWVFRRLGRGEHV